ncbi:uncharacterized protein BCR38DRAFT_434857 [Pseudomassariella vexata]|uniref:F-box domain-containing protein n=1 Tax=Pseudomassariella vexata TaxID=1141098 RepID=A0A1Y2DYL1_9PEZI|nr:uncharacterized protein BCR38DRAFT_434857 [Pseudomassariella vexata]ORY64343.1 hypothetical protein BCR38DRAFT_434857 [Pseudomassariella vexata]
MPPSGAQFASIDELVLMLAEHTDPETLFTLTLANRRFYSIFHILYLRSRLDWTYMCHTISNSSTALSFESRQGTSQSTEVQFQHMLTIGHQVLSLSLTNCFMDKHSLAVLGHLLPNLTSLTIRSRSNSTTHKYSDLAVYALGHMTNLSCIKIYAWPGSFDLLSYLYKYAQAITDKYEAMRGARGGRELAVTICCVNPALVVGDPLAQTPRSCDICDPGLDLSGAAPVGKYLPTPVSYLPRNVRNLHIANRVCHWDWTLGRSEME